MNIKRWLLCAFLFLICFLFLRWLNNKSIIEGNGGGRGRGNAYRSPLYVYEEVYDNPLHF
jgi:hypothetical protein